MQSVFTRLPMAAMFVIYSGEKPASGGFGQELAAIGLPAVLTIPAIVLEVGGKLSIVFGLFTCVVAVILAGYEAGDWSHDRRLGLR